MQNKWFTVTNTIILIVITLILLFIVWNFYSGEQVVEPEECVAANKVASFIYDSCYDAYSKNIFLEVRRSFDSYNLKGIDISFFDFSGKNYLLTDVPEVEGSRSYKISAEKNPKSLDIRLSITKDFSAPICEEPRKIAVSYCPVGIHDEGVNVSISPFGTPEEDIISVEPNNGQDSDVFSMDLVDKERVWASVCESRWECGPWEACVDGIQQRSCNDTKECFIPTNSPDTARYCDGGCVEDWECEWSKCNNGFTTPECKDLNRCGTSYDIPQKLKCGLDSRCSPDIVCEEWSSCDVDYNFADLVGGNIDNLQGSRSRMCVDLNECAESEVESETCSAGVDIYTKRFVKCGTEYIGIYNRLDNSLIARMEQGSEDNPYLNINLDDRGDELYCDYCFDGNMDGDEEGVDCGGSCQSCDDKFRNVDFKKGTWWASFSDWVKKMLT